MTEKEQLAMGKYFVDYDEESGSYCIFHTDYKIGFAFASYASEQEAEKNAKERNEQK